MSNTVGPHSIRACFSELGGGLVHLGHAGYESGMAHVRSGGAYLGSVTAPAYNALAPYVRKTVAVATPVVQRAMRDLRPCAEAAYNRGCYELQEMVKGAVDVYQISLKGLHEGLAKIDRISDRILSPSVATVAKTAVRMLPAAAVTTGMVVGASPLVTGGLLLGASAAVFGGANTGNGAGLGCATAGAVHLASGLVTGSIGSLVRGVVEVSYGARLWRGNGFITHVPARATNSPYDALPITQ